MIRLRDSILARIGRIEREMRREMQKENAGAILGPGAPGYPPLSDVQQFALDAVIDAFGRANDAVMLEFANEPKTDFENNHNGQENMVKDLIRAITIVSEQIRADVDALEKAGDRLKEEGKNAEAFAVYKKAVDLGHAATAVIAAVQP